MQAFKSTKASYSPGRPPFPGTFAAALSSLYRPVKVVPAPASLPGRSRSTALELRLDFGRPFREGEAAPGRHARSSIISQHQTHMSYISEFEQELARKLTSSETGEDIVRWVSEKVLESYRNGIKAGQKGTQVIRDGKSRRKGSFPAEAE